jgi:hypothetical protein
MRLTLPNQLQIDNLSKPLGDALRALKANLGAWGDRQHNADGTHADVVADSLTSDVVRSTGRLIGSRVWRTRPLTANTMPLMPDATAVAEIGGQFFNVLNISGGSSPALTIHGITAAGRELGERIVIVNGANISVFLAHDSASSPDGTRFLSGTGADVELPLYSAIEAVYAVSFSPGISGSYWVLIHGAI